MKEKVTCQSKPGISPEFEVVAEGDSVTLTVRNLADRAGSDVIQIYRDAPECALVGFAKVRLAVGEQVRVTVPVEPKMLRQWQDGWQVMTGEIALRVARHAEDQGLAVTLHR